MTTTDKFGDILFADPITTLRSDNRGVDDESVAFQLYDKHTGYREAYPSKDRSSAVSKTFFQHFLGSDPAKEVFSDAAGEIKSAAEALGILNDPSDCQANVRCHGHALEYHTKGPMLTELN